MGLINVVRINKTVYSWGSMIFRVDGQSKRGLSHRAAKILVGWRERPRSSQVSKRQCAMRYAEQAEQRRTDKKEHFAQCRSRCCLGRRCARWRKRSTSRVFRFKGPEPEHRLTTSVPSSRMIP